MSYPKCIIHFVYSHIFPISFDRIITYYYLLHYIWLRYYCHISLNFILFYEIRMVCLFINEIYSLSIGLCLLLLLLIHLHIVKNIKPTMNIMTFVCIEHKFNDSFYFFLIEFILLLFFCLFFLIIWLISFALELIA